MSARNGIKSNFRDYVMDLDISSPCERLPEDYQNHLDCKVVSKGGFTPEMMAKLRPWWEKQDEDFKWREETEKRLF